MSKYKLVLSSIKNQIHIYSIYIVSLVCAFTFYLTFINLSISTINLTKQFSENTSLYTAIALIIGIFISLLIIYLINYVQSLLVNARSKELAIYRLVSMSSKELRKYLFVEQLIINGFSFILATLFSIVLSIVIIDRFSDIAYTMLDINLNIDFSLIVIIYELLSLVIISLIVTRIATRKIEKKELIDLLNAKHALPVDEKEEYSVINAIFVFVTWLALIYVLFTQFDRLKYSSIGLILIIYIISIFTIYHVIAKIIIKIIPKKIYYKGANSFTISIIRRKLSSNTISMAFVTVLILISTFTIRSGVINTKFLTFLAQYDDVKLNTNYQSLPFNYEGKDYWFDYNDIYKDGLNFVTENDHTVSEYSFNKFADKYELDHIDLEPEQAFIITTDSKLIGKQSIKSNKYDQPFEIIDSIKVTSDATGDVTGTITVVDDSYIADSTKIMDDLFKELDADNAQPRLERFKQGNLSMYDSGELIQSTVNVMPESLANDYLVATGSNQSFNLESGTVGYMGPLDYDERDLVLKDESSQYNVTQTVIDKEFKSFEFGRYVMSDADYENYRGYQIQYISANYSDNHNIDYWHQLDDSDFPGWINLRGERNALMLITNVILSGAMIFISLIMLLLLITMIGVQVNIDSLETKEQFNNLRKIGYSNAHIHRIINRVTSIYFIIPLIIGILNIGILSYVFNNYLISSTTTALIFSTGIISNSELMYISLFMLAIYILYCILVNISYKRVIDKNNN